MTTTAAERKRVDELTAAIAAAQAAMLALADVLQGHNVRVAATVLRNVHERVHTTRYDPRNYHRVVNPPQGTRDTQLAARLMAHVAPPEPATRPTTTTSTEETS